LYDHAIAIAAVIEIAELHNAGDKDTYRVARSKQLT
jgi:hypothetical protein